MKELRGKERSGFTLVELLVVVVVIAVLMAILLPGLSRARAAARRSVCLTRVHGLTLVFTTYVQDFGQAPTYPLPHLVVPGSANYWSAPFAPYGNSAKLRQCPEALAANPLIFTPGTASMVWSQPSVTSTGVSMENGAYAFNGYLYTNFAFSPPPVVTPAVTIPPPPGYIDVDDANPGDGDDQTVIKPPISVTPPAPPGYHYPMTRNLVRIPTFADATWSETWPLEVDLRPTDLMKGNGNSTTNQLGDVSIARHRYSANVAFMDGHAETVPLAQLWKLEWHLNWVPPGRLPIIP